MPNRRVQKYHVKAMFIGRFLFKQRNTDTYDIGIVLDDDTFIEYNFQQIKKELSKSVFKRIFELFQPYLIDKFTEVTLGENVDALCPLHMYLVAIRQHVYFPMVMNKNIHRLSERIAKQHWISIIGKQSKQKLKISITSKVWRWFVKTGRCPWITPEVDEMLNNKFRDVCLRGRYVRLGALYTCEKIKVRRNNELCKMKKIKKNDENKNQNVNCDNTNITNSDKKDNFFDLRI